MLKKIIAAFLYGVYRMLNPLFQFQDISILTYHSISDATIDIAVMPANFEKHLALLKGKGDAFVSLAQIVTWLKHGAPLPRRAVALTFDDGYADFETAALPILEKFGAPAAMFIMSDAETSRPRLGNDLPLLTRESIERLRTNPLVAFGFHGRTHANVAKLSTEELRTEMARPDNMRYFAYPGGSYSHEAMRIAKELGYDAAFAIKPGLVTKESNPYLIQRNVIERDMRNWEVMMRVTKAFEWYSRLSRWFK